MSIAVNERETSTQLPSTASRLRWDRVREFRLPLAQEVEKLAADFPNKTGKELCQVANWLRGPARYEEALSQPIVLAMGLALTENPSVAHTGMAVPQDSLHPTTDSCESVAEGQNVVSSDDLQRAVRAALRQVLGRNQHWAWRILVQLLYPVLALFSAWVIWVLACFFLMPTLQQVYEDTKITLPKFTSFVISSSRMVQDWWWLMILIPIVYIALLVGLNYVATDRGQDGLIDRKLGTTNIALAHWAWHLSLLLEWGLPQKSAMLISGLCSHRGWLQQACLDWIGESGKSNANPSLAESSRASAQAVDRRFLPSNRFQLLNYAISLADRQQQILLLRAIRNYYQEKSTAFIEWVVSWISTLMVWLIIAMTVVITFSVLSPLISLLADLT